jgi:hypothetical protein
MDQAAVRGLRIGAVALLATILIYGSCRESAAQAVERSSSQPRKTIARSQEPSEAPSERQSGVGSMRYYGGPKSPMWRAPATN